MPTLAPLRLAQSISVPGTWQDQVLAISAFLLFPVLVLAPRGAVLIVCGAGLAAACLVWPAREASLRRLRILASFCILLVLLGALSSLWSITPLRSLAMAGRIAGLSVAGLSLVAAAPLARSRSILLALTAGAALGILLAMVEVTTGGALSNLFFERGFGPTRINEAATVMAMLALPLAAAALAGLWRGPLLILALTIAITVAVLSGTTAKIGLLIGVVTAGVFYLDYPRVARLAAVFAALIVLSAPLTFPRLAYSGALLETADSVKSSASHRLLIWSFVGERIAEKPLLGWGLDASRAIPRGKELFRPGQEKLPLHPHNASLQLWLELGMLGAIIGALLLSGLLNGLAASGWPRLYAAAVGGALAIASAGLLDSFSLWNESWQATLWYSAFVVLLLARTPVGTEPITRASPEQKTVAVRV